MRIARGGTVVDSRDEDSLTTLADDITTNEDQNEADTVQQGGDRQEYLLIGCMAGLVTLVGAGLAYQWRQNQAEEADANSYGENTSEGGWSNV